MLTRSYLPNRPLCQLSKFSKAIVRFMLDEAWEKGSFHCVLDGGEIELQHIKDAMRAFHGGLLSISHFITDDENISVSIYR